jgi:hypothetical membrane protein
MKIEETLSHHEGHEEHEGVQIIFFVSFVLFVVFIGRSLQAISKKRFWHGIKAYPS